ncbi:hypothetical protein SAMN05421839_1287 [Halolactibacillus halophilus]|uniref:Uncharacterized protein n=1 Tax=Halolactibacillus halophilus TaxID=306540 RepID=A0A1I5R9J5_9BACI|nr:hypothetical protein [Halolactibacillus halophilus]GEM02955.1 hypothetical protein HHA03_24870 [Halolactibacillus halophilus]SFP55163.1 hypothetical protein SAMN05421839_1287 [Halolactibacillus halophilus]
MEDKKIMSFKQSMGWVIYAIILFIVVQLLTGVIYGKAIDISFIFAMVATCSTMAPLAYYLVNKNFKEAKSYKVLGVVYPVFFLLILLVGVLLYAIGFLN